MAGIPALAADLRDLLRAFADHEVRFLIVGGYALAVHGHPRATGDLDVWIDCSRANAARAYEALLANKRALGRTRDLADVELLESIEED